MRVCPKCGYEDNYLWRHALEFGMAYMPFSDFKIAFPDVAQKVSVEKYVEDRPFVYHLTRGMNVQRQALIDNPQYWLHWRQNYERIDHGSKTCNIRFAPAAIRKLHNQTKLLEANST
jgi:hypothetical protein